MQKPGLFCPYCMYIFPESAAEMPQETGRKGSDRDELRKNHKLNKDFKRINHFERIKDSERIKDFERIKAYRCPVCGRSFSEYAPSPHHLQPGTVLRERYLLGAVLGEGGYGITYTGFDLLLEIRVAIKEYYPVECCTRNVTSGFDVIPLTGVQAGYYDRVKEKYLREARILAKMEKQQVIVGVRDYFEENNTAYIVMEYIEGDTFADIVEQRGGRIPQEELFRVTKPLFGALEALHESGLIHRDICPDNLMLERGDGRIRLLDFGCARDTVSLKNTLTLTLRHGYSPIEQYQHGGGQGPWTDVYELCATFYYCLTGVTPPISTNRITEDTLLAPSKLGIDLPPFREQAVMKGLRIRPHRRYAGMKALMEALYSG